MRFVLSALEYADVFGILATTNNDSRGVERKTGIGLVETLCWEILNCNFVIDLDVV